MRMIEEIGRGVHIGTATNRSYGLLQLPLFSYVMFLNMAIITQRKTRYHFYRKRESEKDRPLVIMNSDENLLVINNDPASSKLYVFIVATQRHKEHQRAVTHRN